MFGNYTNFTRAKKKERMASAAHNACKRATAADWMVWPELLIRPRPRPDMSRPSIVLLGMMTRMPVGGVIWQAIQYLIGLQRLGFDVVYVEDHGIYPAMLANGADPDGAANSAGFIARTLERFDLGGCWWYRPWDGAERCYGLSRVQLAAAFDQAAAVINLHGGTLPKPEHKSSGALIYVETDPVAPEIELHNQLEATEVFLAAHTSHFTYGENIGAADCRVPVPPPRWQFHPTRQPIVMDLWPTQTSRRATRFTTIANWRQPERQMTLHGETYHWSKHHEFLKFIDLPQRTAQEFELALSSYDKADQELLERHGWKVRDALDFSLDPERYREFILESRGEWTVAKDQNVRLRSGWFSDRAASYLAAGRPVVTQETGFSNVLPTGEGLFGFKTMDESVAAIEEINADYNRHSRAAHEIAREFFSYDVVLPRLLAEAGVDVPNGI